MIDSVTILNRLLIDFLNYCICLVDQEILSFLKTQKELFKLSQSTENRRDLGIIACEKAELRNCSEARQEKFLACRRSKELSCRSKNERLLRGE